MATMMYVLPQQHGTWPMAPQIFPYAPHMAPYVSQWPMPMRPGYATAACSLPPQPVQMLQGGALAPQTYTTPVIQQPTLNGLQDMQSADGAASVHLSPLIEPLGALPAAGGHVQESDRMELLPDGPQSVDTATSGIRLVSLGCYCGPKLSFKKMGRGSETLPFDWMRTRLDGLLDFMRNDFEGFFDVMSQDAVPNSHMTVYRNYNHSFWHDDPRDPQMQERYKRRMDRFMSIDANNDPVLFVRVMATTEEILRESELMDELTVRFGREAHLLCIAPLQDTVVGPALVDGCPRLMLHYLHCNAYVASSGDDVPYAGAVQIALDWIVGRPVQVMHFDTLLEAHAAARPSNIGDKAFGLNAFEEG